MKNYQSGIKYRSICKECNNIILGKNDEEYKRFIDSVTQHLILINQQKSRHELANDFILVNVKINRVLRAICGHFLAMKSEYDDRVLQDVNLREYILDESKVLTAEKLFCWLYPYNTIINSRDVAVHGRHEWTHPHGFISVMASFPLAFLVSSEDESSCALDNLGEYSTSGIEETVPIYLHLKTLYYPDQSLVKRFNWPLDVSDEEYGALFAMGNKELQEASRLGVVIPRSRNKN